MKKYKVGFGLYWLMFAAFSVYMAQFPGYVRNPEDAPYPWDYLAFTLALLAFLTAVFYLVLRPPLYETSKWRLPTALVIAVGLVTASFLTFFTDMPGLYYMPHYFSLFTMLILVAVSLRVALCIIWRKFHGAA